jgi:hypothetical protein
LERGEKKHIQKVTFNCIHPVKKRIMGTAEKESKWLGELGSSVEGL